MILNYHYLSWNIKTMSNCFILKLLARGIDKKDTIRRSKNLREVWSTKLITFHCSWKNFVIKFQLSLEWQMNKYKYQEKKKRYKEELKFQVLLNLNWILKQTRKFVAKDVNLNNKTLQALKCFLWFAMDTFKYLIDNFLNNSCIFTFQKVCLAKVWHWV